MYDEEREIGNKVLAITSKVELYGNTPDTTFARLIEFAKKG